MYFIINHQIIKTYYKERLKQVEQKHLVRQAKKAAMSQAKKAGLNIRFTRQIYPNPKDVV